ncbi:MAG: hypothetical protein WC829_03265 [Hyphomicrobium sp.]|jgi:hypothetical protein
MSTLFDLVDFAETRPADTLPCLHSLHDLEHYESCLQLTCPTCGLTERSAYALYHGHDPYRNGHTHTCSLTQALVDQSACCMSCRRFTFGHTGGCQWKGCPRFEAGHQIDHHQRDSRCLKCGAGSRVVFQIGAW